MSYIKYAQRDMLLSSTFRFSRSPVCSSSLITDPGLLPRLKTFAAAGGSCWTPSGRVRQLAVTLSRGSLRRLARRAVSCL